MKKGITSTLAFELEIQVSDVEQVIFTFKEKVKSEEYLLQKEYPSESVIFEDNKFKCKLTQEETDSLSNTFFVEAQINLSNKSVIKSDICKKIMPPTLWTTFVEDNESSGNEEIISLTFTDYVEGGGSGGTTNYNELSNKPRFNGIEWVGNKTDSDMGIATKDELQTKQDTLADGNGVKIENDEISVDLSSDQSQLLKFLNGQLILQPFDIAYDELIRQELANSNIPFSLASKSYVDDLMSGATKWEFVSQLPTEDIDIHTIYFVPKQSAETDNIYDEWVYAIQSRNPDVYDWELLGTSQVDLSNYYTKTESDDKYQPIIDSTHKVSADNIDDSQSTNKFTNATEKTYWNTVENKVNKVESKQTVAINGTTSEIGVTEYCVARYSNKDLASGEKLYLIPIINNVEQTPIDITNKTYDYINEYDAIKFSCDSAEERHLTLTLTNRVITERQYANEMIALQRGKQNKLTVGNGIDITSDTISTKISGSFLMFSNNGLTIDTSVLGTSYTLRQSLVDDSHSMMYALQPKLTSQNKLDADYVDDTNATNKFVTAQEKQGWDDKADDTTITTDTTSTTVSLTLADNHEYRYTQDLSSLTLTMPSGDFISSIVFASGSTPTSMTYDSNIKWSGDDVTNGQFVPSADKDYDICLYYNGLNVNGIVRGV